jgi:hypothetical protein
VIDMPSDETGHPTSEPTPEELVGVDEIEAVAVEDSAIAANSVEVDDYAAMRAENEQLRRQLAAQQSTATGTRSSGQHTWRKILAGVLAALAIVTLVAGFSIVWLETTLGDEDQFVATLAPLPQEESVASVLSLRVADGVVEAANVEVYVAETLPAELEFIALPVTNAITTVVATASQEVITSDVFNAIWSKALRVTHKAVSAVLSGNDGALVAEGGQVAIDLDEVAAQVAEEVESLGFDLPEGDLELGAVVLYEDEQLAVVQAIAQTLDTAGWFIPLLALVFIVAAIWVSYDRRRMTAILGFGTAIGLALSLVGLRMGRNWLINAIEEETKREAAGEVWDTIVNRLFEMMWAGLILALIVGVAAWVMGPGSRARRTRAWASRTIEGWRRPVAADPNSFTNFVANWKPTIEVVAVVAGLIYILFGPSPSGFSVLLTAVIVLAVVVVTEVLAAPEPEVDTEDIEEVDVVEVVDVVD